MNIAHPSSIDLEAFACGDPVGSVEPHLRGCATCAAFVERLRGAVSAGPSRKKAADVVAAIAARTNADDAKVVPFRPSSPSRSRWLARATTMGVPLAAAAILLFYLRAPKAIGDLPPAAGTSTNEPSLEAVPGTTFKGAIQVAVIRERGGEQARFTGNVAVRPNDRLRVEVALDRQRAILAGVVGDDGSWIELMSEGVRRPGTHFSDRSAKVDTSPLRGTILVGAREAVTRARETQRFDVDGVSTVRIEWEPR